ncbi:peptidoglycan-binding protein LysM [Hanstruepera neustonica]|uniref:Peptidoglycan-binding protein LysM n=1 Tax=Hanstruepera neustonica TaxID=1445657 RepID=A0A2K1DXD6_9FLAO|nr:peptidoglycan-binding protein LysM [Hanstruepera neustonica]PNQ72704.1 peptidoglycan-binding protein LysM [Hanstruepera neustonica]
MRKNIGSLIALSLTICVLLFSSFKTNKAITSNDYSANDLSYTNDNELDPSESTMLPLEKTYKPFSPTLGKSFVGFKEALGFKESGGDYFTVNTFGYLGKYQFGKETLKMIGVYNLTHFLNNPEIQEKAFLANAERNKWILRKDIDKFVGKTINGIHITESGILAAAHLAGPGNVKKYLRSYGSDVFADAFGTTIQHYIKKFSGYDTSMVKPNRKAKVKLKA